MPQRKQSQAGFTLIELLIAVVILAIGLLGLAQLQVTAIRANSQGATKTAATAIAQKVVEEIAAMSQDDPMFDSDNSGTWADSPYTVVGGGTYDVTYDVDAQYDGGVGSFSGVTNLCRITITVTSTTELVGVANRRFETVTVHTIKRAI